MTSSHSSESERHLPFEYDVIVPAYNAGDTIAATLRSVMNQEILPQRVILVDDGSTDDTAIVAEDFAVEIHRRAHAGVAATRAFGLGLVRAPVFVVADADDEWLPTMAANQASWWRMSDDRTGAIGASPIVVSDIEPHLPPIPQDVAVASPVVVCPVDAWRRNPLTSSATFYSTDAVRSIGGFGSREQAEDYDTHLRLLAAGYELRLSSTPGVRYHERMGSVTSHIAKGLRAHVQILSDFHESDFRRMHHPELSLERRLRQLYIDTLKLALRRRQALAPLARSDALALVPAYGRPFAAAFAKTKTVSVPTYHALLRGRAFYRATVKQWLQKW